MAKIDELKERIGILKFWLGIFVATILAVSSWCISNYENISFLLLFGAMVLLCILFACAVIVSKKINETCKEIGKL